jgi:FkbM family methyltransferase
MYKYKKLLKQIYTEHSGSYPVDKRIDSYIDDEPFTVKWIESFTPRSIFFDVGSNIGGFSLITHFIESDIKTFSFEPNFKNFYTQVEAIRKNNIKNIYPFNLAINDRDKFNNFIYDSVEIGSKGNFGDELKNQLLNSEYGNPFKEGHSIVFETGILGVSLDSLVYRYNLPVPNYIKIDVDGNDFLVLKGAKKLLNENSLKEIFIEVDDKIYDGNEVETFMSMYNFKLVKNIQVDTRKERESMRMLLYKR